MGTRADLSAAEIVHQARAVIFDCDDTLTLTVSARWKVLIATAREFGVSLTEETIRRAWGLPFDQLIRTIVPEIDFEEFVRRYRVAMRENQPEAAVGVVELLRRLDGAGVTRVIVGEGAHDLTVQDLEALGLVDHFANIYCQDDTQFYKPDPRVLSDALKSLHRRGFSSSDLVYIGDSIRDYKSAQGNSIEFVAVLTGLESRAEFVAAGVPNNRIVNDLTEILHPIWKFLGVRTSSEPDRGDISVDAQGKASPRTAFALSPSIQLDTSVGKLLFCHLTSEHQTGVVVFSPMTPSGAVPVRIHSSCLFSETLFAVDCDCKSQLKSSMEYISHHGGYIVYLYEEGRGVGLANKFKAMSLQQEHGIDTAAAFANLGFEADPRDFALGAEVIATLVGAQPVGVLTNNPRKIAALERAGVQIAGRISLMVAETPQALQCMSDKMRVLGHLSPEVMSVESIQPSSKIEALRRTLVDAESTNAG